MKLATLKSNNRDGQLVIVSRDLTKMAAAAPIANTLQQALDDWETIAPKLQELSQALNHGELKAKPFDVNQALAPLPRAYQWADGSTYLNHVTLMRQSRGDTVPKSFWTDPLLYQGGSDRFLGATTPITDLQEEWGIDFEAEVAVITRDVPLGATYSQAQAAIVLVLLVNDISLRHLVPAELAKGFGFFQAKPASSASPVAVTLDELESVWDGGKVCLPLLTHFNDQLFGSPNAGVEMAFDFPKLIQHAAKTRQLIAGSIVGSGTVSNADRATGSSCIAERRAIETIEHGKPITEFMHKGDKVRIEMLDQAGQSIFGAIAQTVE